MFDLVLRLVSPSAVILLSYSHSAPSHALEMMMFVHFFGRIVDCFVCCPLMLRTAAAVHSMLMMIVIKVACRKYINRFTRLVMLYWNFSQPVLQASIAKGARRAWTDWVSESSSSLSASNSSASTSASCTEWLLILQSSGLCKVHALCLGHQ